MELTKAEFISELNRIFKLNGMGAYLNAEISEKFYTLTVRMLEENEKYNLTAIKEPKRIIATIKYTIYPDSVASLS